MQIVELTPDQDDRIRQCAAMMVEGFGGHWPNYVPDLETALEEVHDTFGDEWISRVAVDGDVRNLKGHPFEFYQRLGFTVVGLLPDANGPGKPDIFLAKRIERPLKLCLW